MLLMALVVVYSGFDFARTSIGMWEHSYSSWSPPIWEIKLMVPIGGGLLVLQIIGNYIRDYFLGQREARNK